MQDVNNWVFAFWRKKVKLNQPTCLKDLSLLPFISFISLKHDKTLINVSEPYKVSENKTAKCFKNTIKKTYLKL